MKVRFHLVAWLGLVVPTLAIGALAIALLAREQTRLHALQQQSAQAQAQTVADNIDLIMAEIKTGALQALQAASGPGDETTRLRELVASNPFVSHYVVLTPRRPAIVGDAARIPGSDATGVLEHFLAHGQPPPWEAPQPARYRNGSPRATAARGSTPYPLEESARSAPAAATLNRQSIRSISQLNVDMLNTLKAQETLQQTDVTATPRNRDALPAQTAEQTTETNTEKVAPLQTAENATSQAPVNGFLQTTESALAQTPQNAPLQTPRRTMQQALFSHSGTVERIDGTPGWLVWYQLPGGRVNAVILDTEAVLRHLLGAVPEASRKQLRLVTPAGTFISPPTYGEKAQTSASDSDIDSRSSASAAVSGQNIDNGSTYAASTATDAADDDTDLRNTAKAAAVLSLPIGNELPGWQLQVAATPLRSGYGFLLLGGLLVAALCAATLGAGTLLLIQARRDAREAVRKTTFVSNVSHELRTPLTTIRMYAEMLEDQRVANPQRQRSYLSTITAETQRLSRLVDNVLDFSRLEQNQKKYRKEAVNLVALIQTVLDAQAPRLRGAGFAIHWEPPAAITVCTDADAIGQVLINLIDNAIKYAACGKFLGVGIRATADSILLTVEDHGAGVPAKDRQRIFKAFERLDERLTAATPGSGLGLSICRGIINDLGGRIELDKSAQAGCRFLISLPNTTA